MPSLLRARPERGRGRGKNAATRSGANPAPLAAAIPAAPALRVQRSCACGGTCPRCQASRGDVAVSHPHDAHEREADRAADAVAARGAADASRTKVGEPRSPAEPAGTVPAPLRPAVEREGRPLPAAVRGDMEAGFGRDFGHVRVHDGPVAGRSARALRARAWTLGSHVVFANGQFRPASPDGRRLIAHELAHVVQQTQPPPAGAATRGAEGAAAATRSRVSRAPDASARSRGGPEEEEGTQTRISLSPVAGTVQRDLAIEPPRPDAEGRVLDEDEMNAALEFNRLIVGAANADRIHELRDVLGISPDPAVIDEEFVNAVLDWQAMHNLTQDGMLGPRTARPLFREIGAEGVGRARLVSGPSYRPSGTQAAAAPGGAGRRQANFALRAEFEDDPANGVFASCGEIRQFIRWDAAAAASFAPGTVPHGGFPAATAAGTWVEDRDNTGVNRYGHRSGRFSDPQSFDQYTDGRIRNQAFGHLYRGSDTPREGVAGSLAGTWRFMIVAVDVCNGGARVGGADFVRVNW